MMLFCRYLFVLFFLLLVLKVDAANQCSGKGVMAGLDFEIKDCAVAFYESNNSVTLWFSGTPIAVEEREKFELNSYANDFKKDSSGKPRTMITVAFCPGDGKPAPSPDAVKSVEIAFKHETADFLGTQDQWVLELPKDKQLRFEKLSGELKLGGTLNGRLTGELKSDGKPFRWAIDFQMTLPEKAAAAGPGCGS
jgi:hypothetical protein